MRRFRMGKLAATLAATAVLFTTAACEPVENAPPGGGEVIEESYRIGPFNLSPEGQPGADDEGFRADVPRPPGDVGIKSMSIDLVDAEGNPIGHDSVHLHHVVMLNTARQSMYCENWPERFAATGSERTPMDLPDPYAYMTGADEPWHALWHIMNTSDTDQEVYIQWEVGYQPGATAENTRGVTPYFLDVTGCGDSTYDVPGDGGPDSVHTNTRAWQAPWDGYLVSAAGHVHGGGIDIALRDEANDVECRMTAEYGHSHGHDPGSITTCPIHVGFDEGQEFSVVSRYHNDEPVQGAMGIVMAYAWQGAQ